MQKPHDLNLMRVLVAIADTRRVTLAARHLAITQPGLSNALRRLRATYDDPLFVQSAQGMHPTARALPLIAAAREILDLYERKMLRLAEFSPESIATEFRFALSDLGEMVFLPRILDYLRIHAPRATVRSISLAPEALRSALEDGAVDLAIGYFPDLKDKNVFQQRLFSHGFVCLVRVDHPQVGARLTRQQFMELEHAVVLAEGRSQEVFENYLQKLNIERRVVLHVPHFMSIPLIIATSDLIVTVPLAVGTSFAAFAKLKLVEPPFEIPCFDLKQHWHRRGHVDPRVRWLRGRIASLFHERSAK